MKKHRNTLLVYFPGYGSTEKSTTFKQISEAFPGSVYIKYDNVDPEKAQKEIEAQMEDLISKNHDIFIVGSSLGGYWANFAACKYKLPEVLINPSLDPTNSLKKYKIDENYLKKYAASQDKKIPRTIFLGKLDKTVDPTFAESMFKGKSKIVWVNDEHRLKDFKPVIAELNYQINNVQDF